MMMACQKCGSECERQSNRQKFCRSCSPHFRKSEPFIEFDTEIAVRKQVAKKIRNTRRHKRYMSRFGKWLLILEEETGDHLWTRSRYVSELEMIELRERERNRRERFFGLKQDVSESYFAILRDTGGNDNFIFRPDFYRAEPLRDDDFSFRCVCSGGVPGPRNATHTWVMHRIREHQEIGRQKGREFMRLKREREYKERLRRIQHDKTEADYSAKQFFTSLAMAGSVRVTTKGER